MDQRKPYRQKKSGQRQETGKRKPGGGERPRPQKPAEGQSSRKMKPVGGGRARPEKKAGRERPRPEKPAEGQSSRKMKPVGGGRARPEKKAGRERPRPEKPADGEEIRLNRYIAASGICSRRDADGLITSGAITVNGKVVKELGSKVKEGDVVRYHGVRIRNERKVYLLLNKPKDYVTTTDDPKERKTVMQLVRNACTERIYPVGRLDRNSTGLLLFTNDGELARKLTHPSSNKKKIYHVFLDREVTVADMDKLSSGITLEDGFIRPDAISWVNNADQSEIGLEIHSGRNRIVRRMFESLGYRVNRLDRVYFAGLTKKNLPRGKWRFLTPGEIRMLKTDTYR